MLVCPTNPVARAILSLDRAYRYRLSRQWGDGPRMLYIGLNPSMADEVADDPTVRRMQGFASRERCGGMEVCNLFALIATAPRDLLVHPDPVGIATDLWLAQAAEECCLVVACWGGFRHPLLRARTIAMHKLVSPHPVHCLGRNADGSPRHPLYLPGGAPLEPYWS